MFRRVLRRPRGSRGTPTVATLDGALWERVGRLLVARGRLSRARLASAVAEQRRTGRPLDEILVERGDVTRHAVASTVLVVQLGRDWREQVRVREGGDQPAQRRPLPDVPVGTQRTFTLACVTVDASVLTVAALLASVARSRSNVQLPPTGWMAVFAALTLGLYWAWRLATYRRSLRPWADAVLIAGAAGLAAMTVLTIRSLTGHAGGATELLPLWAFATVYCVAGRLAFYLVWTVVAARSPEPADRKRTPPERTERSAPSPRSIGRRMEVVPLHPELWGVFDELRREVDAIVREQREGLAATG
jgi:hypothetical protein